MQQDESLQSNVLQDMCWCGHSYASHSVWAQDVFECVECPDEGWEKSTEWHKPEPINKLGIQQNVLQDVRSERRRQDILWGDQTGHSNFLWSAILGEEFGEVCNAALKSHFGNKPLDHLREELIQVAAVAVAWVEAIDSKTRT